MKKYQVKENFHNIILSACVRGVCVCSYVYVFKNRDEWTPTKLVTSQNEMGCEGDKKIAFPLYILYCLSYPLKQALIVL